MNPKHALAGALLGSLALGATSAQAQFLSVGFGSSFGGGGYYSDVGFGYGGGPYEYGGAYSPYYGPVAVQRPVVIERRVVRSAPVYDDFDDVEPVVRVRTVRRVAAPAYSTRVVTRRVAAPVYRDRVVTRRVVSRRIVEPRPFAYGPTGVRVVRRYY